MLKNCLSHFKTAKIQPCDLYKTLFILFVEQSEATITKK